MRRTTRVLVAITASALLPLTVACGAVGKAIDCGQLAIDVTASAERLSRALSNAENDPQAAKDALDELERDLGKLEDKSSDSEVKQAVDKLGKEVRATGTDLDAGRVPSGQGVADAAENLAGVCTPS